MKRNNKKGFTIVELVIVIAVIAILSAVLIPTFGNVINEANAEAAVLEAKNAQTLYLSSVENVTALGTGTLYVYDAATGNYFGEKDGEFANLGTTAPTYNANNVVITMDGVAHTCGYAAATTEGGTATECTICHKK